MTTSANHYDETLQDLERRYTECQAQLADLEQAITALKKICTPKTDLSYAAMLGMDPAPISALIQYGEISVRWGILGFLFEKSNGEPMKTADIADALIKGGSKSANRANVSAVISDMVKNRLELESKDDGYTLTEKGRVIWNAITHSSKFREKISPSNGQ